MSIAEQTKLIKEMISGEAPFAGNLGLRVSMGLVEGFKPLDKFGENNTITTGSDPEDVWEGGGVYEFSTTADIVSISSSDNSDTQDIKITGLTLDGTEVEQTVTLQGQTRVALTTPLWRVYRMENEADIGGDLAGTVYCYSGTESTGGVPDGASVEKARIENGNNQTLMAIYTVPAGKVGFLYRGEVGMNFSGGVFSGNEYARCYYQSRRAGKVFKIKKAVTVMADGSSNFQDYRSFPDIIPAMTDIKLQVAEVSATMGVWGTFDILLIDEDLIDLDALAEMM